MLLEIFQLCRGFSREYKFTVGESLKKEAIDLLTLIFRANSRHNFRPRPLSGKPKLLEKSYSYI
jgi:hypothetical protein